jgi:hypothetical protein
LKSRSLWISASASLAVAAALAGCGTTTYFAGRSLPPSGIQNRVMIAVQNTAPSVKGALDIVDAFYDTRYKFNNINKTFSVTGYGGSLPVTIQNMPEELEGAVYGSGDGSLQLIDYSSEKASGNQANLGSLLFTSVFVSKNYSYAIGASLGTGALVVADQTTGGGSFPLGLPGVFRVSMNQGGTAALAFVQNSNYIYYPRRLTSAQTLSYSGGQSTWPKAAIDCEPKNAPVWCLFQAQSPDAKDSTGNYYGTPLVFDHPTKAIFSSDGSTAYILSCGPECGGNASSVTLMPVAPFIFALGLSSGQLPTNAAISTPCSSGTSTTCNLPIPGGATNALVTGSNMYVVGQQSVTTSQGTFWGGNLTAVNLTTNSLIPSTTAVPNPVSISDGTPGGVSRMILADDNTLWIGMTKCTTGVRFNDPADYPGGYGCLTMHNVSSGATLLMPYIGDATGIAAVSGLHKIYTALGGQVYIYSTTCSATECPAIDNSFVTVTGTAWDVAYIDATSDGNNTVY